MSRFHNRNFELLEPYDAKVSCTVLRGESIRKDADLLDITAFILRRWPHKTGMGKHHRYNQGETKEINRMRQDGFLIQKTRRCSLACFSHFYPNFLLSQKTDRVQKGNSFASLLNPIRLALEIFDSRLIS